MQKFSAGSCEHGDKPSGYIKCEEFLVQLGYYQFLKEDFPPWIELPSQ
jgi:hypothetical protein